MHGVKIFTALVLCAALLFLIMLSKFSYMGLVRDLRSAQTSARETQDHYLEKEDARVFFTMIIVLIFPVLIGFCQNFWVASTISSASNSRPSGLAFAVIVLEVCAECVPSTVFCLAIAPRLNSMSIELVFTAMFLLPIARSLYFIWREQKSGKASSIDDDETKKKPSPEPRRDVVLYCIALFLELCGLVAAPILFYYCKVDVWICASVPCIALAWSVAFEPSIVKYMNRAHKGSLSYSARPQAGCYACILRLIVIIGTSAAVLRIDDHRIPLGDFISIISSIFSMTTAFKLALVHLVATFLVKFLSNLACTLAVQRFSFMVPFVLATPLFIVANAFFCRLRAHSDFLSDYNLCFDVIPVEAGYVFFIIIFKSLKLL
jgi:hypothetical protein